MLNEVLFQTMVALASVGSILLLLWLFHLISKRRYQKPKELPFCPNCGSTALISQKTDVGESYFVGSLHSNHTYACQSCDYVGACPVGTPKEIENYKPS